jgi:hypothetical protein
MRWGLGGKEELQGGFGWKGWWRWWWQGDVSGSDELKFLAMVMHVHGRKYIST